MTTTFANPVTILEQQLNEYDNIKASQAKVFNAFESKKDKGAVTDNGAVSSMLTKLTFEVLVPALQSKIKDAFTDPKTVKVCGSVVCDYLTSVDFKGVDKNGTVLYFDYEDKVAKIVWLTITAVMNGYYGKKNKMSLQQVGKDIVEQLELEATFNGFAVQNKWLFDNATEWFLKDPLFGAVFGAKQLSQFLTDAEQANKFDKQPLVKPEPWNLDAKQSAWVAQVILELIQAVKVQVTPGGDASPLFLITQEKGNDTKKVVPGESIINNVEMIQASLTHKAFVKYPMLSEPVDWTEESLGGYALNDEVLGFGVVRQKVGPVGKPGPIALAALNNIQSVQWCVNANVVGIANTLRELGISLGKLSVPTASMTKVQKIKTERKGLMPLANLAVANELLDAPAFWIPWNFDWRGRMYPQATFLHPQSDDFGKSLIRFAEPCDVTEQGVIELAHHIANTYGHGVDKQSLSMKVAWMKTKGVKMVKDLVKDPIKTIKAWISPNNKAVMPEDVWQFIAAAYEYYHVVVTGEQDCFVIPCGADATQSGIQNMAGLTLDVTGAELTNIIPVGDVPSDCYMAAVKVAKQLIPAIAEAKGIAAKTAKRLANHLDRSVAKKVVMTLCYNATFQSQNPGVLEKLNEKHKTSAKEAGVVTTALRQALTQIMPYIVGVMKTSSAAVKKHADANNLVAITWHSPSGFEVVQTKCEVTMKRVRIAGTEQLSFKDYDLATPNSSGHASGFAPNFIHSLDSAQLHLTFAEWDKPFACIHDCVLARPGEVQTTVQALKETFVKVYSENVLEQVWNEIGLDPSKLPAKGDLDVTAVLDSEYYFS